MRWRRVTDHIDTAQFCGPDIANELIHEALQSEEHENSVVSFPRTGNKAAGFWWVELRMTPWAIKSLRLVMSAV